MRRTYLGWAIAMIATLGPMQAWGGDREIAEQIISRLKVDRDSGALKDFTLDMKVDQGVVCFRGNVSRLGQKELVLQAAEGVEGIAEVVDELTVSGGGAAAASKPQIVRPQGPVEAMPEPSPADETGADERGPESDEGNFSFRQALAGGAAGGSPSNSAELPATVPGEIRPASAVEPAGTDSADQQVTAAVVSALGQAQKQGRLKGFGVEVKSQDGVVQLTGRAESAAQRDLIVRIAEQARGVAGVRDAITVRNQQPNVPQPPVLQPAGARGGGSPQARLASARGAAQMAPHRMGRGPAMPAGHGTPMAAGHGTPMAAGHGAAAAGAMGVPGQPAPVPAAPVPPAGAPRYDSPYLPNYAWPGYAAYPNYAAVTYPQQYSPTAFPYIGPFYPYPQVPLGWRKVSLEWDDGWWFLDFTDK